MGKSSAVSDLLNRMSSRFDLVIAFIGSASCNPVLRFQMEQHWDDRFFFSQWDVPMITRLLNQQEYLKKNNRGRQVLILMDDVVLSSQANEQICNLAMRGRHFNISLMMCSVSYTTMPKRMRRSLDVLLVFSCPMEGDMKVLTSEFAHNTSMAKFALLNLGPHQSLVLETLERRQQLFVWKANLLQLENTPSLSPVESNIVEHPAKPSGYQKNNHQINIDGVSNHIQSSEAICVEQEPATLDGPL